jgi:hypothetical protein
MVEEKNEILGGGYGGGSGILGLIALLSLFRGNLWGGNHEGASVNLAEIENQVANIRADIGDVKYDSVVNVLNQTNTLMSELCNGKFENAKAVWEQTSRLQGELFGIQKDILRGQGETNLNIVRQGFENQLSNERQTNILGRQIGDGFCCTSREIERSAFATQLRDLEYQNCNNRQFDDLKRLIVDTAKDQELAALRKENDAVRLRNEINRSINATVGSWAAAATFNGVTYPAPPFNGAWGF